MSNEKPDVQLTHASYPHSGSRKSQTEGEGVETEMSDCLKAAGSRGESVIVPQGEVKSKRDANEEQPPRAQRTVANGRGGGS